VREGKVQSNGKPKGDSAAEVARGWEADLPSRMVLKQASPGVERLATEEGQPVGDEMNSS